MSPHAMLERRVTENPLEMIRKQSGPLSAIRNRVYFRQTRPDRVHFICRHCLAFPGEVMESSEASYFFLREALRKFQICFVN